MEKAKAAVSNFLNRDGKHETTVHETVNPAIENERVNRTQHENVTTAVDREVHQDHFHTTVQPIQHQEVLPEKHSHNIVGAEEREFQHGNNDHIQSRLEQERAQFQPSREVGETQYTSSEQPSVVGEHIHHHVHETIQPVVQKETIQPHVVHTTIPVHEVHHNEAKHHAISSLPAMTMNEFQSQGGALGGREERTDAFAGEPRAVGSTLGQGGSHNIGGPGAAGSTSITDGNNQTYSGERGGMREEMREGMTGTRGEGMTGTGGEYDNTSGPRDTYADDMVNNSSSKSGKPSLMDKMNPKIDADGDGKAGFMS